MTKNIYQRMHAVMQDLEGVELVKANGLRFKIIQHDDVTAALRPLYLKHGIVQEVAVHEARQLDGGTTELLVRVTWVNIDDPKDRAGAMGIGHSTSEQKDKTTGNMRRDDLGVGKALSYAVKMAQLKNFALLSGDGDLETEQAKEPPKMAGTDEVERVLNLLASATDQASFQHAASEAAKIAGSITSEQTKLMGSAWQAAKKRVTEEPIQEHDVPVEEGGLTEGEMVGWMNRYKFCNTKEEFGKIRRDISEQGIAKKARKAQWAILAEKDQACDKQLRMQQEAAR